METEYEIDKVVDRGNFSYDTLRIFRNLRYEIPELNLIAEMTEHVYKRNCETLEQRRSLLRELFLLVFDDIDEDYRFDLV
jgi:hypothetical protein